eukprot:14331074-Alexandrium_andersonii.AAC.1
MRCKRSVSVDVHRLTLDASEQTALRRSGRAILAAYNTFIKTLAAGRKRRPAGALALETWSALRNCVNLPLQHCAPHLVQ